MAYNSEPRADLSYVPALKSALEARYGGQRSLDQKMRDLYLQHHKVEGRQPPPDIRFRAVGTGFVGLLVDQDVSILGGNWQARVNAPKHADERHVSEKLEPAITIGFELMQQYSEVWRPMVKDSRIYGRAVALGPIPDPMAWGSKDLQKLYKRLEDAEESEKDAIRKEIGYYHGANLPIIWERWNPPDVYCTFSSRKRPLEVVYCRKMYPGEIVDAYGDEALPDRKRTVGPLSFGRKGYSESEQCEVVYYVNSRYFAVCVPDKADPKVAHQWEHKMGCTPVTFAETNRIPDNDQDWMWGGAALHIRESIHALDDAYTDWRTHIRQSPRTPLIAKVNAEARGQLEGWPQNITVTGDENEVVNMLIDETLERGPIPGINPDLPGFVDRFQNIVGLLGVRRDALMGAGPSGQSAVHLNVAQTLEKGELAEAKTGLERGLKHAVSLFLTSIQTMAEEYPEAPDKIPVGQNFSLSAKDVRGYSDLVQVTIDLNLPINEGLAVQAAAQAVQSRLLDPYTAREMFLRLENPVKVDDRWLEYDLFQIAGEVVKSIQGARVAGGLENIASNPALARKMASLSEFAQAGIAAAYGADVPNVGRSQANRGRTGAGQDMSQLNGTAVRLP